MDYDAVEAAITDKTKAIITVDLGEAVSANQFKVYAGGGGGWGISSPSSVTVEISTDGKTFTEAGKMTYSSNAEVYNEGSTWNSEVLTLQLEENVNLRYARFTIGTNGNFAWIEEIEVCKTVQPVTDAVYITGFNRFIYTNDCSLFNHEVGNLRENDGAVNAKWTQNILLKWDKNYGCYTVVKSFFGDEKAGGGTAPNITLAEDELLLAVHGDSSTGAENRSLAKAKFKKGVKVGLYGVDVENAKLTIASFARVIPEEELVQQYQTGDITGDGNVNAQDYMLLKRIVLNKYTPSDDQRSRCDVTGDGSVNAKDYMLLKRVVLGTGSFK